MNNNFKQNNITEEEMRRSKEILSNIVNYYSQK